MLALLKTAEQQWLASDFVGAGASLERAIRISPRDPALYYRLATVRLAQQNYHQAKQLCRKAMSLSAGNADLQARCRMLMAQAEQASQGD